ncbi:MAG: GNAT family N-acetyltransferase [Candidatus Heimdallarchaeota archaeon]
MNFSIVDLDDKNIEVYLSCGCNPKDARITQTIKLAQEHKRQWTNIMKVKGLVAKIAYDKSYPAGFIEYIPIEFAPAPVKGKNFLFITDIHVNDDDDNGNVNYERRGCGRQLVDSVEQYARNNNFNGISTLALNGDWMPATFYQKIGFQIIEQYRDMFLLVKIFKLGEKPNIWKGNFQPTVRHDIVHIDLILSSQCWGTWMQVEMWKQICKLFPNKVELKIHMTDDRTIMSLDSMTGSIGVYLNGYRGPGYPIDKDTIKSLIEEAISKIKI